MQPAERPVCLLPLRVALLMDRRSFLGAGVSAGALAAVRPGGVAPAAPAPFTPPPFAFEEATVDDLQRAMAGGQTSARALAAAYLARIDAVDRPGGGRPGMAAVIEVNPDALAEAARLDAERKAGRVRGPLHGIPVLLKDNVDTGDRMQTTAGSLALAGPPAPRDATLAARLRAAGAVLLGKTNLSEWANFRSTRSSSGWSGRGGQTRNPYALDRSPCGSSSGSGAAVAANLCALAVGTETDGSIVCPSGVNGVVGIKPTLGLVSRAGVIPIAHSQDTAGPMARTVRDAALLLGALAAGGADPRDAATAPAQAHVAADYAAGLDAGALRGARVGVLRSSFGFHAETDRVMEGALRVLRDAGAVLVDPVAIATTGKWDTTENDVLQYELKADMNAYLAERARGLDASAQNAAGRNAAGDPMPRTLADLIAFNTRHADRELQWFGQELFEQSQARGPLTDAAYQKALADNRRLAGAEGIDATLAAHRLDAIVAPTNGPAWTIDLVVGDHFGGGYSSPSAVAGYPHVTVPAGFVHGLPVGLSFFAGAWSEPRLIRLAYAFEQATRARRAPTFRPTIA
ncbi:amidase [Gemmatimonadetes bacterium T265]|nr:amidase [Gemmatimonadetes bacterium T265]